MTTAIITDGSRKQLADGCFSSWRHLDKRILFDERILLLFDEFPCKLRHTLLLDVQLGPHPHIWCLSLRRKNGRCRCLLFSSAINSLFACRRSGVGGNLQDKQIRIAGVEQERPRRRFTKLDRFFFVSSFINGSGGHS